MPCSAVSRSMFNIARHREPDGDVLLELHVVEALEILVEDLRRVREDESAAANLGVAAQTLLQVRPAPRT
ncbi:MAG: hypothetical protein WKF40_05230 [Thermoleophilaceae bacterium]